MTANEKLLIYELKTLIPKIERDEVTYTDLECARRLIFSIENPPKGTNAYDELKATINEIQR